MESNLRKGMVSILIANIANLVFSIITNFVLPKYLSVGSYAATKTFQLYSTYVGAIHLGYIDGMYLKYGGKCFCDIDKKKLNDNLSTLRIFQFITMLLLILIGFILKDKIVLAFGFATLPLNMTAYYKFLYQAIGEFDKYSKVTNLITATTFIINMFLLFFLKTDNYLIYLIAYVAIDVLIWIALEIYMQISSNFSFTYFRFSIKEFSGSIKTGVFLMFGNFSSIILSSMDRWFVMFFMNTMAFAQYSFAVSMESFITVAISPVTVTLYNFFCKTRDTITICRIRNYVMIFAVTVVASAFPAKFILETYLTKYLDSNVILFFLFAAQIYYIVVKGIYVNLYKAENKQRKYFTKLLIVIISGSLSSLLCYALIPVKESFSAGILLSAILWFILSKNDFKKICFFTRELVFIFVETVLFIGCGIFMNAILGLMCYLTISILLMFLLLREDMLDLIGELKKIRKKVSINNQI